jgi:hypothetical protein
VIHDAQLKPAPSLLFKINENQLALQASNLERSNRVEQLVSADVASIVRGPLEAFCPSRRAAVDP